MEPLRILVTCCLGDYMKSTIANFRRNPDGRTITIIGCDMLPMEHNFVDVDDFVQVSSCTSYGYVQSLYNICKEKKVDVLIPFHTNELELLSVEAERFEKDLGTKVAVASIDSLYIVNDKIRATEFMKKVNLNTPKHLIMRSWFTFVNYPAYRLYGKFPHGFVVKQRHNCGGRGMAIYNSCETFDRKEREKFEPVFDADGGVLIQEIIKGEEYTVDMIVSDGEVLYGACKRNEQMENGVARKSTIVTDACAERILKQCADLCKATKYTGNIGFDVMLSESSLTPFIIDVNPRLTATVSLVTAAGVNLPYLGLKMALGEPIPSHYKLKDGVRIVRKITDTFLDKEGNILE